MTKKRVKQDPSRRRFGKRASELPQGVKRVNYAPQMLEMNRQRAKFEANLKKSYRVYCYPSWITLSVHPVKPNKIVYFMVYLDIPLTKEEIQARMVKGFGNLEQV